MTSQDKIMSMAAAIERYVKDGDTVYIGGFISHDPFAAVHEIIRQKKRNLTLSKCGGLIILDQLIGAGCASKVVTSYIWNPIPRPAHAFIRALREEGPERVQLEEYPILALTLSYFAGALDLPYVATKTIMGADFARYRSFLGEEKLKIETSPFTGEKVCLIPPLKHDVGIIQVHRADMQGNAQTWGFLGDTKWGLLSCKKIIVCAEEIVSEETVLRDPQRTLLPGFRVDAVVAEPWGSHPSYLMGCYDLDWLYLAFYERETRTADAFERYLDDWVYGLKDRGEYIEKLGAEKLAGLKVKSWTGEPVSYGFTPFHQEL
ncbi:MAG: CoA transferase subunit A [Deltaproteobacteria bacterium]|nr:CoA transferase subunit A [Deltaproteobacteria bacterium]